MSKTPKHLLLISQVYVPDPAAVGQYMADVAEEMTGQGWQVTVFTSNRGYDDPSQEFPASEVVNGVTIKRLPFSSFGKKTILTRLIGQSIFCLQAMIRGIFLPNVSSILVTTSPPIGGVVGWIISLIRRVPFNFWVMDLNPDQAIAQGVVGPNSLPARVFDFFNRRLLKRASSIIALDGFMAENVRKKTPNLEEKIHVIPPWPLEQALEIVPKDENPFIKKHQLEGKFVLMYSGNHSPVHPLETFLDAARELADDDRFIFFFIGGGKGKKAVDDFIANKEPGQVLSLPYQPLDQIKYSLSAADIHLVSMGAPMIGCVHPCKFYGSMSLAKPILYLGPSDSHIGKVIEETSAGWQIDQGNTSGMVATIKVASSDPNLPLIGEKGRQKILSSLSKQHLCHQFSQAISPDQFE
ncbi:glycosyltransferase family 4 protein [Akkermansiaceae bacterium]|nr:glycosyltransferase family 4 protein [Akkermansiaceae bacterium]MDB4538222.1 glycosyltransferase family 4 protein [Akkermansiaceae bacterium]MDB4544342.1 glycosyltransferase family 4 protein [Akkermansiaceae bacterium]